MTDLLQKRRELLASKVLYALSVYKATNNEIQDVLGMILHDLTSTRCNAVLYNKFHVEEAVCEKVRGHAGAHYQSTECGWVSWGGQ